MQNYVILNSRLYSHLFKEGGDNLIAVYGHLKFGKEKAIKYYKQPKVNIYKTLSKATKLSVSTLHKYIPKLQQLGLVRFDSVGNFVLIGNNQINKIYKKGRLKLIPLEIGTYKETKVFSVRVRILNMEQAQKNRIDRRDKQNNIIARANKGYTLSKRESKQLKNLTDKDIMYFNSQEKFTAKTVLSNLGFSKLKNGATKSKSSGKYWKDRLVKANIIVVKRNFKFIKKCSQKEYISLRYAGFRKLVYRNGRLFEESPSEFSTDLGKFKTKESKPLEYLSFDMIAWWAGQ